MKRHKGFSFAEVLVTIALTIVFVSFAGTVFVDGWRGCHLGLERSRSHQQVLLLMQRWQGTLRDTDPSSWRMEKGRFKAGACVVYREGRHLVVVRNGKTIQMKLPRDSRCRFGIEQVDGSSWQAVLHFTWPSYYVRMTELNKVRFVACGKPR